MKFKLWLEARLKKSIISASNLDSHVETFNYQGWNLYFKDRVTEKSGWDEPLANLLDWMREHGEEVDRITKHVAQTIRISSRVLHDIKKLEKYRELGEEGYYSILYKYPEVINKIERLHLDSLNDPDDINHLVAVTVRILHKTRDSEYSQETQNQAKIIPMLSNYENLSKEEKKSLASYILALYTHILDNTLSICAGNSYREIRYLLAMEKDHIFRPEQLYQLHIHEWDSLDDIERDFVENGIESIVRKINVSVRKSLYEMLSTIQQHNLVDIQVDQLVSNIETEFQIAQEKILRACVHSFNPTLMFPIESNYWKHVSGVKFFDQRRHIEDIINTIFDHGTFLQTLTYKALRVIEDTDYQIERKENINRGNYNKWVIRAKQAAIRVIDTLFSFGIRKFQRTPIVFYYQTWNEKSVAHGISVGGYFNSYRNQHTKLAKPVGAYGGYIEVFGDMRINDFIDVISHEIGHSIFDKLSYQDQQTVKLIAKQYKVSDYGDVNYTYPNKSAPGIGHTSGNEWFAEMIAFFAKNHTRPHLPKDVSTRIVPQNQAKFHLTRQFNTALANQSQTSLGYKDQADNNLSLKQDKWQQRAKEQQAKANNEI